MITYENRFTIEYLDQKGEVYITRYKCNPHVLEKDIRETLRRLKAEKNTILDVSQKLDSKWVSYIK